RRRAVSRGPAAGVHAALRDGHLFDVAGLIAVGDVGAVRGRVLAGLAGDPVLVGVEAVRVVARRRVEHLLRGPAVGQREVLAVQVGEGGGLVRGRRGGLVLVLVLVPRLRRRGRGRGL